MKILWNILIAMRPEQWTKNIIIFAGPLFAKKLSTFNDIFTSVQIFCIFCLVSSASYILNDILDRKEDAHHPDKCKRPIARGDLKVFTAGALSVVLTCIGLIWAMFVSWNLVILVSVFLLLHVIYDIWLKHITIVDVFAIAFAFLIRLIAGMAMYDIGLLSSWILLCTFLLALFLALCKRRAEIVLLSDKAVSHRKSLEGYSMDFLTQLISILASCSIMSYALYVLLSETVARRGLVRLRITIPLVAYGIFRYLYLVHLKKGGANPEKVLLKDIPFLINMIAYALIVIMSIYH